MEFKNIKYAAYTQGTGHVFSYIYFSKIFYTIFGYLQHESFWKLRILILMLFLNIYTSFYFRPNVLHYYVSSRCF